jgi:hypothetical protein
MKDNSGFFSFRIFIAAVAVAFIKTGVSAQNKSMGVGTSTPNPNAALHIESPTNNQGIIIPRLTTAQRTAIALTGADAGLLVYDADLKQVLTWDGTQWNDDLTVQAQSNDTLPAIYATNTGTPGHDSGSSTAILAETTTAFSALVARVPASASTANAISGITKSTDSGSWAGYFDALTGTAVYGTTRSNVGGALAPVGVYGESRGTGSVGGAFWIQNASNNFPALYSNTIGVGSSFSANINNPSNGSPAIIATTNGTGAVLQAQTASGWTGIHVMQTNAANSNAAVFENTGVGNTYPTLQSNNAADGSAGNFNITNPANTAPALYATSSGSGSAVYGDNTGNGQVFYAVKSGANGSAGNFQVNNTSNTNDALFASTTSSFGTALGAMGNDAAGQAHAFTIWGGGMRVSTKTLTGGGNIDQRAVAYQIDANSYTLNFPLQEGDTFYFYNSGIVSGSVNGIAVPASTGITTIYLAGVLRSF